MQWHFFISVGMENILFPFSLQLLLNIWGFSHFSSISNKSGCFYRLCLLDIWLLSPVESNWQFFLWNVRPQTRLSRQWKPCQPQRIILSGLQKIFLYIHLSIIAFFFFQLCSTDSLLYALDFSLYRCHLASCFPSSIFAFDYST